MSENMIEERRRERFNVDDRRRMDRFNRDKYKRNLFNEQRFINEEQTNVARAEGLYLYSFIADGKIVSTRRMVLQGC